MASSVDDQLCCPVCMEGYTPTSRLAKLLPDCFHTVCLHCIELLPHPTVCPLDRGPFVLPPAGAAALTTNYALMDVVEAHGDAICVASSNCVICEEQAATLQVTQIPPVPR